MGNITDKNNEEELDNALKDLSDEELETLIDELEAEEELEDALQEDADTAEGTCGTDVGNFKTNMMSIAMKKLSGMTPDQMAIFMSSLDSIGHEADAIPPDAAQRNQASIAMKGAIAEDLQTIFGAGEEISEDVKKKMTILFESAVSARLALVEQELINSYNEAYEEEIEETKDALVEQVDKYLSYVAEEFIRENQVAIESSLKHEITSEFMEGLKNLFQEHYIDVPSEKEDLVDALSDKIDELQEQMQQILEDNIELSESLKEKTKNDIVEEMSGGLTLSQVEKLKQLTEDLDFDGNVEDFVEKVNIIREHNFEGSTPSSGLINEEIAYRNDEDPYKEKVLDPTMKYYVKALSLTNKK